LIAGLYLLWWLIAIAIAIASHFIAALQLSIRLHNYAPGCDI
jgi:hypothetical protein